VDWIIIYSTKVSTSNTCIAI